ncbi:hypothetical protein PAXINDRAFT_157846 [Paxillus involutus ATCC 200175]|uniref:Uncharacterized protein n=1 Tax=Paxillus involutus ATCC 200175 TaxID=664439 RepID=A0A0C9SQH6_PAXIN|nr:hypothetical protein PAXINDRAFT_157846 [Paxillus involutus ATCC 200175]
MFGSHAFPAIVRDYQKVIRVGREIKVQNKEATGKLPDVVGMRMCGRRKKYKSVQLFGSAHFQSSAPLNSPRHSVNSCKRKAWCAPWSLNILRSNQPEHSWLKDGSLAEYAVATDEEALRGFPSCTQVDNSSFGIVACFVGGHRRAKILPKENLVDIGNLVISFALRKTNSGPIWKRRQTWDRYPSFCLENGAIEWTGTSGAGSENQPWDWEYPGYLSTFDSRVVN